MSQRRAGAIDPRWNPELVGRTMESQISTRSAATGASCRERKATADPKGRALRGGLENRFRAEARGISEPEGDFQFSAPAWTPSWPISRCRMCPWCAVAVGDLTGRMTEYVVQHVLMHSQGRSSICAQSQPRQALGGRKYQWSGERDLGRHHGGLATLGADAAEVLRRIGFSASPAGAAAPKQIDGIDCFFRRRNRSTPFLQREPIFWSACCR